MSYDERAWENDAWDREEAEYDAYLARLDRERDYAPAPALGNPALRHLPPTASPPTLAQIQRAPRTGLGEQI